MTVSPDLEPALEEYASAQHEGVDAGLLASYVSASRLFAAWLHANGHSTRMTDIAIWHVDEWEADLRTTHSAQGFHDNHRGLQRFLSWYAQAYDPDWRTRSAWRHAETGDRLSDVPSAPVSPATAGAARKR